MTSDPDPDAREVAAAAADAAAAVRGRDAMPRWVPRALLLAFALVVALLAGRWLLHQLRTLVVMLLVSLFLSFAMEPAVNRLAARGIRRGLATAVVMFGAFIVFAVFLVAVGSLLVDQVRQLIDNAPDYIEDAETWVNDTFDTDVDAEELVREFQEGGRLGDLAQELAGNVVTVGATVVSVLFQLLTIALFTFYLIADGPRFRHTICQVLPEARQRQVLDIWELAIQKTGNYLYSRFLLSVFSASFHLVAFVLIDLPSPLVLALWVGIVSQFIPVIGTYLAGLLPALVALADQPVTAIWVLAVIIVYQQVENYLLAPRITAHTMELHPAVAFGLVIAGAALLGPVGAVLALPAGAVIQAFISSYLQRHEVIESSLIEAPPGR